MKRRLMALSLIGFLSIANSCLVLPVAAADKDGDDNTDEALVISLAENWKLANQRWSKNENVVQYLPAGADKVKPAEMITVTTVTNVSDNQNAKTYILQVKQAMESAKEAGELNWHLIKDSASDASCEYTFTGNAKIPSQHEMMRVIRGGAELHSVIYHFGKASVSEAEKRRAWDFVDGVKLTPAH